MSIQVTLRLPVLDEDVAVGIMGVPPQLIRAASVFLVGLHHHVVQEFQKFRLMLLSHVNEDVQDDHAASSCHSPLKAMMGRDATPGTWASTEIPLFGIGF